MNVVVVSLPETVLHGSNNQRTWTPDLCVPVRKEENGGFNRLETARASFGRNYYKTEFVAEQLLLQLTKINCLLQLCSCCLLEMGQ
ncbi:hypothetical protein TNIN_26611 [Trichonephila inaurata madagascariensis]|uniref:Uncharacterized protein n=1 Tax=Trichonephila inaurata madagascariensis TaxID=2747483 RepID=A0A8X6XR92_9ARAC|nr:hypothetical protein TNIN_26611 [Trichonephila inaurata madagascariensis]